MPLNPLDLDWQGVTASLQKHSWMTETSQRFADTVIVFLMGILPPLAKLALAFFGLRLFVALIKWAGMLISKNHGVEVLHGPMEVMPDFKREWFRDFD
jgi:hypothetical protein